MYGGFSGSDRYGVAFTTAMQLSRINQFALSSYYYRAIERVRRPHRGPDTLHALLILSLLFKPLYEVRMLCQDMATLIGVFFGEENKCMMHCSAIGCI